MEVMKIYDKEINNKHDKTFKIILENKDEAVNFINRIFKFEENLEKGDLERYNSSFITKNLKSQEADIIYKIKNQNVFILIEHQTKIDYSMPYRVLNYQIETLRNCIDTKKVKNKKYEHALIIAIVLYTGNKRWTAKTRIREIQATLQKNKTKLLINGRRLLGNYETLGNYVIVDSNNYTREELLADGSFLSQIILLEKSKNKEELLKNLLEIIINKINEKEGDNMLAMVEMLEREKQSQEKERKRERRKDIKFGEARGKKSGRKEERIFIAKKMLKENLDIKMIQKITGLKKEQFM